MSGSDEQHELCFKILRVLVQQEEHEARNSYPPKVTGLRNGLVDSFPPLSHDDLERTIAPSTGPFRELHTSNRFIFLPACDKGGWFIPVLSIRYDFAVDPVELRIRAGLFALERESVGYRFETPEGPSGIHSYYHAQPIVGWASGDASISSHNVNQSQPAFPVDADSPVTLLMAAVLSCYGLDEVAKLTRDASLQRLKSHLGRVHWRQRLSAS